MSTINLPENQPISTFRLLALVGGPLLALVMLQQPQPMGMNIESWRLVTMVTWMMIWWLSEAIPIPATALLPIPVMPLMGIDKMDAVAAHYAHSLIFLFLGGFLLAAAMQRWGLHRRIALGIVNIVGTTPGRVIGGFMLATAFLSMWISNTATAIMMYAVGLSVIDFIDQKTADKTAVRHFGVALMLGIAYSASIGGVGTLIGTPPNALLASFLASTYDIKISFSQWMLFGIPIVLIMLPIAWLLLTKIIFPANTIQTGDTRSVLKKELRALGPMSMPERIVALVFTCTAISWILQSQLKQLTGLPLNDTSIALIAALILFACPASRQRGEYVLDWDSAKQIPWGILLLFGGGLALARGFKTSGLADWIGHSVATLDLATWGLLLAISFAIIYLTEITSNTASTATFLPILGAVAVGLGEDPRMLTIPIAVGASMAFMMPVATPPNAIVFSYEAMKLKDMVKAGFFLNIIAVIVTFMAMMLLARAVFDL